jgi:hypothetical protein
MNSERNPDNDAVKPMSLAAETKVSRRAVLGAGAVGAGSAVVAAAFPACADNAIDMEISPLPFPSPHALALHTTVNGGRGS